MSTISKTSISAISAVQPPVASPPSAVTVPPPAAILPNAREVIVQQATLNANLYFIGRELIFYKEKKDELVKYNAWQHHLFGVFDQVSSEFTRLFTVYKQTTPQASRATRLEQLGRLLERKGKLLNKMEQIYRKKVQAQALLTISMVRMGSMLPFTTAETQSQLGELHRLELAELRTRVDGLQSRIPRFILEAYEVARTNPSSTETRARIDTLVTDGMRRLAER
jgi:hypothetical protein